MQFGEGKPRYLPQVVFFKIHKGEKLLYVLISMLDNKVGVCMI